MKRWYVDDVAEVTSRTCQHCGRGLAWVEGVGWVDPRSHVYDMCPDDPYGNHLPDRV